MIKRMMSVLAIAIGVTFVGYADEALDVCFQFQTLGDDCYADGSMLEEGECYALVWRHNDLASSIEGLFDDKGIPVNAEKCEILGVFNTAAHGEEAGHQYSAATNSWIVLPKEHYSSHNEIGVYSVFVFDTRTWDGQKWVLGGKTSDKTVASLRRYGLVTDLEDIKLGSGAEGTFFSYNVAIYGTAFVGNEALTSTGDSTVWYSCANTPVVCSVSFYVDEETLSESRTIDIDQPIGTLPTPERVGFIFGGWFTTGGEAVTPATPVTSGMKLYAKWTPVPEPVFASLAITNGTAYLSVTNTVKGQKYDISWVTDILKVFSTTNWVDIEKTGEASVDTPLTWEIDLKGQPQGFFRILTK